MFLPTPLVGHGSTDGHFLLLLFLFFPTSNFLFLLGTENTVGGVGLWQCMPSCLPMFPRGGTMGLQMDFFFFPFKLNHFDPKIMLKSQIKI